MEQLRIHLNGLSQENQKSFSDSCGTTIGYLRKAISANDLLNPITCVQIEKISNGIVSRKDLRPDDWVKIWPELLEATKPESADHRHISDRRTSRRKKTIK